MVLGILAHVDAGKYNGAFQLTGEEPRTSETATARLPELRLDTPDAATVNAEVHERLDSLFNGYDNNGYVNARADYTAALNGNQILSLAVETRSVDTPNSFFMVYNFNVEAGHGTPARRTRCPDR